MSSIDSRVSFCKTFSHILKCKCLKKKKKQNADNDNIIKCEFFELPGGEAGFYIMKMIIEFLDFKALSSLMITSVIQQFCRIHKSLLLKETCESIGNGLRRRIILDLNEKYAKEYPRGTPLIVASELGRLCDVKQYIEIGKLNINMRGRDIRGNNGYTALMQSCWEEHVDITKYLLKFPHINITSRSWNGLTVLHIAALINYKNHETLKLILNHEKCTASFFNDRVFYYCHHGNKTASDIVYHNMIASTSRNRPASKFQLEKMQLMLRKNKLFSLKV